MNDFKKEYVALRKEIESAVTRVGKSGWYILGKEVEQFEEKFAGYVGTKYCLGVANGLEALQISLMALGIGKGDEVITVSNTAVATVLAISNTGATPVFVDANDFYLMNVEKIEAKITKNTKAILPVHLFGQMVDMKKLTKIAKKHKLTIIEDACQAHGATQNGKKAGSIGTLGCFSFYPTKNLGALGDGGAITTNSLKLYKKCMLLRNYGQETRYHHKVKGLNSRLDELQAAILLGKLKKLDLFVKKRNTIAAIYSKHLSAIKHVRLPKTAPDNYHTFHLFVIEVEKRDELQLYLLSQGIQSLIHYPIPVHKQTCYSEYNLLSLPRTERAAREILSLPIHPFLTKQEVLNVCNAIKMFYVRNYEK